MKLKQILLPAVALAIIGQILFCPITLADVCGDITTSILPCDPGTGSGVAGSSIWGLLIFIINILTTGIGVVAVAGIVYGAILYTSAGGNADQLQKAKGILKNVAIGLAMYFLMFSFLNFLIPGGMFN